MCKGCLGVVERREAFSEIEVAVVETHELLTAIEKSMVAENLTDENRYFCSICGCLQDAIRTIQISHLPLTLNVHLTRFVFDVKTYTKKKTNVAVTFPMVLDMSTMVGCERTALYDLTAVLLHQGTSAESGHYVARIYDRERGVWLDADDENVKGLESPWFQIGEKGEKAGVKDVYSSKAAYLLVYERRKVEKGVFRYPDVPEDLMAVINDENARVLAEDMEKVRSQALADGLRKAKITAYDALFLSWEAKKDELAYFVAAETFEKTFGDATGRLMGDSDLKSDVELLIDNTSIVCRHGHLDPAQLMDTKRLSKNGHDNLIALGYQISPILTSHDACIECYENLAIDRKDSFEHSNDLDTFRSLKSTGAKFMISKPWLTEWKKKVPFDGAVPRPDQEPYVGDVFCRHGGISLDGSRIEISIAAYQFFKTKFHGFVSLSAKSEDCATCEIEHMSSVQIPSSLELAEEAKTLKRFTTRNREIRSSSASVFYLIPLDFVKEWKKFTKGVSKIAPRLKTDSLLCQAHKKLICNYYTMDDFELHGSFSEPKGVSSGNGQDLNWIRKEFEDSFAVTHEEWEFISKKYAFEGPVVMFAKESDLEPCAECKEGVLMDYESVKIKVIERTTPEADVSIASIGDTGTPKDDKDGDVVMIGSGVDSSDHFYSTRKKRRTSNSSRSFATPVKTPSRRKIVQKISITPVMTVKDLKTELSALINVPQLYQKLFFKGLEGKDEDTMNSLRVYENDVVEIEVFEEGDKAFDTVVSDEAGFQGTMLSGLSPFIDWICGSCTLVNGGKHKICSVCESPRAAQIAL